MRLFFKQTRIIFLIGLTLILSCTPAEEPAGKDDRLAVIATIFPLYDFARNVGGDKVAVSMLLPPGSDVHHYELKPNDIIRVSKADIFLFTSFELEQWAYKIINAAAEKTNMLAVETGQGAFLLPLPESPEQDPGYSAAGQANDPDHASKYDPHIWLDAANAQKMIDNIAAAFILRDSKNSEVYRENAERYKRQLTELDEQYRTQLSACKTKTVLHAGHWAFAYLANRYHLHYRSAYNSSADAEPSPQQILSLMEQVRAQKLRYIYYEDLVAPKLAATIASETGVELLKLNNGHDVGKKDFQAGETYLSLMEKNLINLKKGMQCR
jgi:zinc transport system substrate-binding protein